LIVEGARALRVLLATPPAHKTPNFLANVRLPALGARHPMFTDKGWIVAYKLCVAALQFGHPLQSRILVKCNNLSQHAFQLALGLRHSDVLAGTN